MGPTTRSNAPISLCLGGARPGSRLCCTTHSPSACSGGAASCCLSWGPSQVGPPHPYPRSPSAPAPTCPKRLRACRTSPLVPGVPEGPRLAPPLLLGRPLSGLQRTAVPVPWPPRSPFVPTPLVPIAAGWGCPTCGPMVLPGVVPGASCTAPRATARFPSLTARCCRARRQPRRCWSAGWRAWPQGWACGPLREAWQSLPRQSSPG